MELQIQGLISSIKKDGIEAAQQESAAIVAEAQNKAQALLADAKAEAEQIRQEARQEADMYQNNAVLNAQQARRDATLAFTQAIEAQFEKILAEKVHQTLDDEALVTLIRAVLQGENVADYTVEVNAVTDFLRSELDRQIRDGLTICPNTRVRAGFRLAAKDGSGYFDCSDEEISRMLMPYFRDIQI